MIVRYEVLGTHLTEHAEMVRNVTAYAIVLIAPTLIFAIGRVAAPAYGGASISSVAPIERGPIQQGALTLLYAFPKAHRPPSKGLEPSALLPAANGTFFGTTFLGGGECWCGAVFRLSPSKRGYTNTTLHQFTGNDGAMPEGRMVEDKAGDLFGVTVTKGDCCGTIYELQETASGYSFSVLHAFSGNDDGNEPESGLTADTHGNMYGTTTFGNGSTVCGTVFKLAPSGGSYTFSTIYTFRGAPDGCQPTGNIVVGDDGSVFGATAEGGDDENAGSVYALSPNGTTYSERILYSFHGGADGAFPSGGVVRDAMGTLFGSTAQGGEAQGKGGCGVTYSLTPDGTAYAEAVLHRFTDCKLSPGAVTLGDGATIYGTLDDAKGGSEIYRLKPQASTIYKYSVVFTFAPGNAAGQSPVALTYDGKSQSFYGDAAVGGACIDCGTVFTLRL